MHYFNQQLFKKNTCHGQRYHLVQMVLCWLAQQGLFHPNSAFKSCLHPHVSSGIQAPKQVDTQFPPIPPSRVQCRRHYHRSSTAYPVMICRRAVTAVTHQVCSPGFPDRREVSPPLSSCLRRCWCSKQSLGKGSLFRNRGLTRKL